MPTNYPQTVEEVREADTAKDAPETVKTELADQFRLMLSAPRPYIARETT